MIPSVSTVQRVVAIKARRRRGPVATNIGEALLEDPAAADIFMVSIQRIDTACGPVWETAVHHGVDVSDTRCMLARFLSEELAHAFGNVLAHAWLRHWGRPDPRNAGAKPCVN